MKLVKNKLDDSLMVSEIIGKTVFNDATVVEYSINMQSISYF